MSEELNPVIQKIGKLHAKAQGLAALGNEAEAQVFAEMVQKMLLKHSLEMTDIQYVAHKQAEPVAEHKVHWDDHAGCETKKKRVPWQQSLCGMVARVHSCQILILVGCNDIILIGRKTDREVAEYVMASLVRAAEAIATKEYYKRWYELRPLSRQGECAGFRASFLEGFANRMMDRYREMEMALHKEHQSTTSLIRIGGTRTEVKAYVDEKELKESAPLRSRATNTGGYQRGRDVASGMALNKGIGNSAPTDKKELQ